jgi:hypothetical protein
MVPFLYFGNRGRWTIHDQRLPTTTESFNEIREYSPHKIFVLIISLLLLFEILKPLFGFYWQILD